MSIIKTLSKAPLSATSEDLKKFFQVLTDLENTGLWIFPGPSFVQKGFDVFGSKEETISVTEGEEKVLFIIKKGTDTDNYTVKTVYENNSSTPPPAVSWSVVGSHPTSVNHHRQFHEESNRLFMEQHHRSADNAVVIHNHHRVW